MSSSALSSVAKTLEAELRKLAEQRDTALRTVDHLEQEMRRIEAAMAVLTGDNAPKKKGRKKAMKGVEISALVERVLHKKGALTEPDVRKHVIEMARAEGKSGQGLPLVLPKVLKSGPFQFNGARWAMNNGR